MGHERDGAAGVCDEEWRGLSEGLTLHNLPRPAHRDEDALDVPNQPACAAGGSVKPGA